MIVQKNNKNAVREKLLKIYLNKNKKVCLTVNGNSMYPILHDKMDVLIVKKSKYNVGDIVVFYFKRDDMFLIHRIIFAKKKFIYLKGDNAYRIEKICVKDILGAFFENEINHSMMEIYCKKAYKLGKYAKRNRYNMKKIFKSSIFKMTKELKKRLFYNSIGN